MSKVDALIEACRPTSPQTNKDGLNGTPLHWLLQSPTFWPINHGKSVAHPLKLDVDSPPVVFSFFFLIFIMGLPHSSMLLC